MTDCRRCDFRGDDLEEHARESGHWLCVVCRYRSLADFEPQTCGICIGRVRADLADILEAFALLEPRGTTALTLLGDGTMQRYTPKADIPLYDWTWPNDPLPVLPALMSWEDFIREELKAPKGEADPTLTDVVGWLSQNLDSRLNISQSFAGFDEFVTEVRKHRSALQHAAALVADPVEAPAECFECGEALLRTYQPPLRAIHGIRLGLKSEGLVDKWTCSGCRSEYDQTRYFLALKAKASSWVSVPLAAETAQKPVRTLRTWIRRLQVTAACRIDDHAVLVWWPDVSDRAFRHAVSTEERSA